MQYILGRYVILRLVILIVLLVHIYLQKCVTPDLKVYKNVNATRF
jgi:hypothetical protein